MTAKWLLKSEPNEFSFSDLLSRSGKKERWDGVRNYQARNFLKSMQVGDQGFFYHSSCKEPAIMGIVTIVKAGYPDPTAFDKKSDYYDETSDKENPRWFSVDVQVKEILKNPITLAAMRENSKLEDFTLLRKGNRLSVFPVTEKEWATILKMV